MSNYPICHGCDRQITFWTEITTIVRTAHQASRESFCSPECLMAFRQAKLWRAVAAAASPPASGSKPTTKGNPNV